MNNKVASDQISDRTEVEIVVEVDGNMIMQDRLNVD